MQKIVMAALGLLTATPVCAAEQGVLTYHNGNNRHGLYGAPGLTASAAAGLHPDPAFHASFSGAVYAQPLYWNPPGAAAPLLIVATEGNLILGLNANTGATAWQTQLTVSVSASK